MPNDTDQNFSSANSSDPKLTDPIAPDLSTPPTLSEPEKDNTPADFSDLEPKATPPQMEPEPMPEPVKPKMEDLRVDQPVKEFAPKPATLPAASLPSSQPPILTVLLSLVSIGAIALVVFFYFQTQSLNRQLNTLTQTLSSQQVSPTPSTSVTPTTDLSTQPTSTISASPTPTSTVSGNFTSTVFTDIASVMSTAQAKYPSAQLIMVTSSYVQPDNQLVTKYWFRQDETTKKYLYVLKDNTPTLSLVDQQVYVTPDNNIPSLNQLASSNTLGLDIDRAVTIGQTNCPAKFDCKTAQISGQYLKPTTGVALWQITFRQNTSTFVIQIEAASEKIIFKS